MCGIVGIVGHGFEETDLRRAVRALYHRGPDGNGVFVASDAPVGLGHTRLSIIDLETGAQPLYSEDRDLVLVCNGEIYDYERIRAELQTQGHVFRTRSDSEVILHLYQEYGPDFVAHLRGEFAFLLYDQPRQTLLAVRDRFGIKPLFVNRQEGRYLFASEAKALFATGRLQPRISVSALRDYLSGVIPDSIFDEVETVPPGCLMNVSIRTGAHHITRYWDLDLPPEDEPTSLDLQQSVQTVRDNLEEAIKLRLRADVPVGVYLSGGIDSSIVAAVVAQYHPDKLKIFNIAFPEDEAFNEFEVSKATAARIGAEFHSVTCDHATLLNHAEDALWVSELPFVNFHGVGKFILSKLARKHVKVVLTGEGADEIFLGYLIFQPGKGAMSDQIGNVLKKNKPPRPRQTRGIMDALGFVPMPEHASVLSRAHQRILAWFFHPRLRRLLRHNHPLDNIRRRIDRRQTDGRTPARRIQYFWIKSMLAPYLLTMLGDRSELGHSLEGRTPFLDHHLFEAARHIPDQFKIHDGVEKYVLREAFKDRMSPEVYKRKKWPYAAPPLWIENGRLPETDQLIARYLSREAIIKSGLFNYRAVALTRWFAKWLPPKSRLKRPLNMLFTFLLTVQIIERQYVQDYEANLRRRSGPTTANDAR